jgi:hypothetical protein
VRSRSKGKNPVLTRFKTALQSHRMPLQTDLPP